MHSPDVLLKNQTNIMIFKKGLRSCGWQYSPVNSDFFFAGNPWAYHSSSAGTTSLNGACGMQLPYLGANLFFWLRLVKLT